MVIVSQVKQYENHNINITGRFGMPWSGALWVSKKNAEKKVIWLQLYSHASKITGGYFYRGKEKETDNHEHDQYNDP